VLLGTSFAPLTALAADGPPPAGEELRVLSRIHTDAVSTFLTGDALELATKADVPEGNGTRFDPTRVLFHLDEGAAMTVPAGYEFIGAPGSQVWMAPETNPSGPDGYTVLWPGFSTESVPTGALQRDETTFTLTGFDGPGDLELFTGGGFGGPKRLWSSDEGLSTFTIGRTHMHANWAFTATGTYTLDVRAEATTAAGTPVAAQNTYTFVVGPMAPATATTTTLAVSAAAAVPGDTVTLDATVAPAGATGWVEFLDGTTTLGHAEVAGGRASLDVSTLPLGQRGLTARFAPALLNDFTGSVSAPVTVTVTEEPDGVEFGVAGWRDSYAAGETIHLRPQGVTPAEGQSLYWLITDDVESYVTHPDQDWVRDATTSLNGVTVALALYDTTDGRFTELQRSAEHTFRVTGDDVGSGTPITLSGLADAYHGGDPVTVTADHAPLTGDQTYRWVSRGLPYGTDWFPMWDAVPAGGNPFRIDTAAFAYAELALQIVVPAPTAEDPEAVTVVGTSPAIRPAVTVRELKLSGGLSAYRVDETIELTSELWPARDGVAYQWGTGTRWDFAPLAGETAPTLRVPATLDLDGTALTLRASDATTGYQIGEASYTVRVTDAAPGEQLVLLGALEAHYHQGNRIALRATAAPVASGTDTYRWEWQRPDQDAWSAVPGATSAAHDLVAEQALDGTRVRAVLLDSTGTELATSETVTIHVDDHGAKPRQQATITGLADGYAAGDPVTLRAEVAPASVLDRWEWYLQWPGSSTPARLTDTSTARLEFDATADLDGAAVFARLTFDHGRAYVESAPVVLRVTGGGSGPTDPPVEPTDPPVDPTDPPAEPTDPPVDPTDPPAQPTDPPVDPTDPPAQPTDPPVDPTDPPAQPTDPPVDPTDPPAQPGQPADAKPATAPAARTGAELDAVPAGGITPSTATPRQGEVVTIALGAQHADAWVAAWMFSTPTLLGGDWVRADAQGTLAVRVPADAPAGTHRIAVFAQDGSLIGWAAVEVAEATGATPTDSLAVTGSGVTPLLVVALLALAAGTGAVLLTRARRRA
jgi:surface-anchored protein